MGVRRLVGSARPFELSTRAYLILLVVTLLLPVVLFAGFVLWRLTDAERSRYRVAALNASERIAAAVDRELAGIETALQALATGRSYGERAYARFYDRALEVKRIINADVLLKDATGQQLINTRVAFGTPLPLSLQDHERTAMRSMKAQVSDLFVGAFSGLPTISVTVPLPHETGKVDLLTIATQPERLGEILVSQALPEQWAAAIVDGNGSIIARSRDRGRFTGERVSPDLMGRLATEKVAWEGVTREGSPALMALAAPQLAPSWRVLVVVPVAVASAPLNQALVPLAVAGILALLASLAIAAWLGERAARAMSQLARSASALGALAPVGPVTTPVREVNRVGAALVGAARDLERRDRDRRSAEDALRRINDHLETAVEERSAQLVQLQKQEAIGQLTGGVAHDFNNLLMAVLGSLELLRKRIGDDPRSLRLLDNARQGAERGASLTQRLLAFARRQDLVPTSVDVAALVHGMADLLRQSLGPQVELVLRFPPDLRAAKADANQLELAVLNLAVNGRDAMLQGGRIVIEARVDRPGTGEGAAWAGDFVVLSVTDSGLGMDSETLRRAAEPFFTTKGIGKGTGLGLSMVHGLVEQLGGRLRLASEVDIGTVAELWLPVAESAAAAEPETARPRGPERSVSATRILVVDDDPLVLAGTTDLLEDLGHTVIQAVSAEQALDHLRSGEDVDLVLTDYAMPGMTGLDLIARLARSHPTIPVVLATGFAEAPELSHTPCTRLGKPFTQAALARTVSQVLHGGPSSTKEEIGLAAA